MNAILQDIYSTILPSAPYVIAAYALVWLAVFVYMFIISRGIKRAEKEMAAIEEALQDCSNN